MNITNTITVNIESQLREALNEGFDRGFESGIKLAVEILNQTTEEHSTEKLIEATEKTFCDRVIAELKDEPITRIAHKKHRWDSWFEPFAKSLLNKTHTKAELIVLGSKRGLTEAAIVKMSWKMGFTCKHKDIYFTKTHSPKTYKLQQLIQKLEEEVND